MGYRQRTLLALVILLATVTLAGCSLGRSQSNTGGGQTVTVTRPTPTSPGGAGSVTTPGATSGNNATPGGASPPPNPLAHAHAPATKAITYQPTFTVTGSVSGSCWSGSMALQHPNAWRCMHGNMILDPCFGNTGAKSVICPTDEAPWANTGFSLQLRKPLGNGDTATTNASPWGIQLADGSKCIRAVGAAPTYFGQTLSYVCTDGRGVFGNPATGTATWTITASTTDAPKRKSEFYSAPIAIAWS